MIVVLDSNVWIKELGLASGLGSATRFYIKRNSYRLALPEVVRLEVENMFQSQMKRFSGEIADNHRQLLAIFGTLKEVVLPSHDEIERKAREIFTGIGIDLFEIPFSFESAKSAFSKTVTKEAPCDKSQEFKDAVLWADCCKLLEIDDVSLVSEDKAFYKDRAHQKGLADNLAKEAEATGRVLSLFPSLLSLIAGLKVEINLDSEVLENEVFSHHHSSIERILSRNSFRSTKVDAVQKELFATEKPDIMYLKFEIRVSCEDISDAKRENSNLVISGDGTYDVHSGSFGALSQRGLKLTYRLPDGSRYVVADAIFGAASIVLGHRDVSHSVLYQLPPD